MLVSFVKYGNGKSREVIDWNYIITNTEALLAVW